MLWVLIFVVSVVCIEMCHYAYRTIRRPDRQKIRKRLRKIASGKDRNGVSILRRRVLSEVPFLNRFLLGIPMVRRLDRLLKQADAQYPLGFFILLTIFLALAGYLGGSWGTRNYALATMIAALLGALPFFYLRSKKRRWAVYKCPQNLIFEHCAQGMPFQAG